MYLERIKKTGDIKDIQPDELMPLASEIREFLIDTLSKRGGHLASNLGVVELTIALHRVMDLPNDKLIWDVGHQSYTHKILTGRQDGFANLRGYGGMSGFPKRAESECDVFDTGHSSTSISAGLGFAHARRLKGTNEKIVAVIGDGSMTGGLAFEALNNAIDLHSNFVIVLNDNEMSISENVGSLSMQFARMRTSSGYTELKEGVHNSLDKLPGGKHIAQALHNTKSGIKQLMMPGMMFEEMGIMYLGPVDGHDISAMEKVFNEAFEHQGPILVHVKTKKGRGFLPAENHPSRFHGTEPFDKERGLPLKHKNPTYTDIFSTVMRKMGDRNPNVVAITAAMMDGTGLKRFHNMFPDRFFDVGLAEEHASTFAAALAMEGLVPVFAVYSSFLQRAYDEILHDICLQNQHVVFAIDRAGLVGADGDTHQGIFDIAYLSTMPGMTVMAPKNRWELSDMVKFAVRYEDGPIAIRYPKGESFTELKEHRKKISYGKSEEIYKEGRVLLFALGSMVKTACAVRDILKKEGIECAITNARFAKPVDKSYLRKKTGGYDMIVTMEEGIARGGFGEAVRDVLCDCDYKGQVLRIAIDDCFVEHGDIDSLKKKLRIDEKSIAKRIMKKLQIL